jgi:hypothetical protein
VKGFLVKLTNIAGVFVDGQFGKQGIILCPDLGLKITRFVLDFSWFQIGVSADVIPDDGFGILPGYGPSISIAPVIIISVGGHAISGIPIEELNRYAVAMPALVIK